MNDLISRQKAIEAIDKYFDDLPIQGYYDMKQLINNLPTIEPKNGKWHKKNNVNYSPFDNSSEYLYLCGLCGREAERESKYCPNCGARMESE